MYCCFFKSKFWVNTTNDLIWWKNCSTIWRNMAVREKDSIYPHNESTMPHRRCCYFHTDWNTGLVRRTVRWKWTVWMCWVPRPKRKAQRESILSAEWTRSTCSASSNSQCSAPRCSVLVPRYLLSSADAWSLHRGKEVPWGWWIGMVERTDEEGRLDRRPNRCLHEAAWWLGRLLLRKLTCEKTKYMSQLMPAETQSKEKYRNNEGKTEKKTCSTINQSTKRPIDQ